MKEVENLLQIIQPLKVIPNLKDKMIWKENKVGNYLVKLMYELLNLNTLVSFPVQSIWSPLVLLMVGFFAWEASWGKVLTLDHLKPRGRPLANRCFLCETEEIVEYLLIHCQQARLLWESIVEIFGVSWVMPFSFWQTLLSWQGAQVGKKCKKV